MCLRMRFKALFLRHSEEADLFGTCGTISYKFDKVGKAPTMSTCDRCAFCDTQQQLVGGGRTSTQEHMDFVEICRVPTKEYEGRAR